MLLWALSVLLLVCVCADPVVEDVYVPEYCERIVKPTDHVLLTYAFKYANGTVGPNIPTYSQPFHLILEQSVRV